MVSLTVKKATDVFGDIFTPQPGTPKEPGKIYLHSPSKTVVSSVTGQVIGTPRDLTQSFSTGIKASDKVASALNYALNKQQGAWLLSKGKTADALATVRAQIQANAIKKTAGEDVAKAALPALYGTQKKEVAAIVAQAQDTAEATTTLQKETITNIINTEKLKETTEKYVEIHEKYVELQKEGGGGSFDWKQIGLYAVLAVAGLIGLSFLLKSIGGKR